MAGRGGSEKSGNSARDRREKRDSDRDLARKAGRKSMGESTQGDGKDKWPAKSNDVKIGWAY